MRARGIRWDEGQLVAYVGKLEVGRISLRVVGYEPLVFEVWTQRFGEFGLTSLGKLNWDGLYDHENRAITENGRIALERLAEARKNIEEHWMGLVSLMNE